MQASSDARAAEEAALALAAVAADLQAAQEREAAAAKDATAACHERDTLVAGVQGVRHDLDMAQAKLAAVQEGLAKVGASQHCCGCHIITPWLRTMFKLLKCKALHPSMSTSISTRLYCRAD